MDKITQKQIEIEYRALLSKKNHKELEVFLNKNAQSLGGDDKNVFFFIFPDKLLKVVDNISKQSAKTVLKLNKIGKGSDFEEIEIPIKQEDVGKAVKMFSSLGFDELQESFQKRHNYLYKEVELALKYSDTWGYHLELEVIVSNNGEQSEAERKIRSVAEELGVKIMTDEELAEFTKNIDQNYKKGVYKSP